MASLNKDCPNADPEDAVLAAAHGRLAGLFTGVSPVLDWHSWRTGTLICIASGPVQSIVQKVNDYTEL